MHAKVKIKTTIKSSDIRTLKHQTDVGFTGLYIIYVVQYDLYALYCRLLPI